MDIVRFNIFHDTDNAAENTNAWNNALERSSEAHTVVLRKWNYNN